VKLQCGHQRLLTRVGAVVTVFPPGYFEVVL
jgi:hypothetical protein